MFINVEGAKEFCAAQAVVYSMDFIQISLRPISVCLCQHSWVQILNMSIGAHLTDLFVHPTSSLSDIAEMVLEVVFMMIRGMITMMTMTLTVTRERMVVMTIMIISMMTMKTASMTGNILVGNTPTTSLAAKMMMVMIIIRS